MAEFRFSCWSTKLIFGALYAFSLGFWKIKNTIGAQCQSDWQCWGSFVLLKLPLLRNNVQFYFLIMSLDVFNGQVSSDDWMLFEDVKELLMKCPVNCIG